MPLEDFEIQLKSEGKIGFSATIHSDSYGTRASQEPLRPELSEGAEAALTSLEERLTSLRKFPSDEAKHYAAYKKEQTELGQDLFGSVFHGSNRETLSRCLGRLDQDRQQGLRIRVSWHEKDARAQEIVCLPWELLHDGGAKGYLARRLRFPVSRYLQGLAPVGTLEVDGPLRVLLVESNPDAEGLGKLDIGPERAAIRRALDSAPGIEVLEAKPDLDTVRDTIRKEDIHVLHFMGHGWFEPEEGWAHITFADEDNRPVRHRAEKFAAELADLASLKLVVLSSCYGASLPRLSTQYVFNAIAPALMRQDVPAVIAMQSGISDASAATLSRRLYTCLVQGDPVDVALAEARRAVSNIEDPRSARAEWAHPVVYMRVKNGVVFRPPETPREESAGEATGSGLRSGPDNALRVGLRTFDKQHAKGLELRVDRFLPLERHFDDRRAKSEELWNSAIRSEVLRFLEPLLPEQRPIELEILVHSSLAFTAGWVLEAKTGLDLHLVQRSWTTGRSLFSPLHGEIPSGKLWNLEKIELDSDGQDVAVAVSLTHDNVRDVVAYLQENEPTVGRVIHAFPVGGVGHGSVKNGAHAFALAQRLAQVVGERTLEERKGMLHVFLAAPNAFSLYFGQVSRTFGRVQLYELPFSEADQAGIYWPSIQLPPEDPKAAD